MFKILRVVLTVGWSILYNYLFYIWRWARHPEKVPLEVRYARLRRLIIKTLKAFHVDYEVKGLEILRKMEEEGRSCLFVPNHLSFMDPLVLIAYSEKPISFIAKTEVQKFPFINPAMKIIDGEFLDRDDLRQSVKVIKSVSDKISSGRCSFVIFAEGTRNRNPEGDLPAFHSGSFKVATRSKCPIIPISLYGTQRLLDTKLHYKRYPIALTYLNAVEPEQYLNDPTTNDISVKIHDLVANEMYFVRSGSDKEFLEKGYEKIPLRKGSVR